MPNHSFAERNHRWFVPNAHEIEQRGTKVEVINVFVFRAANARFFLGTQRSGRRIDPRRNAYLFLVERTCVPNLSMIAKPFAVIGGVYNDRAIA